jgi:hypothetical protein
VVAAMFITMERCFSAGDLRCRRTACNQMENERRNREEQKQMDQSARDMKDGKAANPCDDQKDGKKKKHGFPPLFLCRGSRHKAVTLQKWLPGKEVPSRY